MVEYFPLKANILGKPYSFRGAANAEVHHSSVVLNVRVQNLPAHLRISGDTPVSFEPITQEAFHGDAPLPVSLLGGWPRRKSQVSYTRVT